MFKKILSLFVICASVMLCLISCSEATPTQPHQSAKTETEADNPTPITKSVFKTEDIVKITFFAYYGAGTGSVVSNEDMEEIISWLASFTIGEIAEDTLEPGTGTYVVEIEYSDGTVIKEALDTIESDGTRYYTNYDKAPDCFYEIVEKSSL